MKIVLKFCHVLRKSIHELLYEDRAKYDKVLERQLWQEEEMPEFYDAIDKLNQAGSFNPFLFDKSSLVIIFSYFEKLFKEIVNAIRNERQIKIRINDIEGSDIEKCYKYLSLIIGYDLSNLNEEWSKICDYQKIRNLIVHHFGEVPEGKITDILRIIESSPHLELNRINNEIFIVNEQYLIDFCDVFEKFLYQIATDHRENEQFLTSFEV